MNLLSVKDASIHHGSKCILHDVSLTAERGEIITIVGPNGSGKSTLLKAIVGSLPISGGSITLSKEARIGYVPQKLEIDRTLPMSVRRFLNLPIKAARSDYIRAIEQAGLEDLEHQQMTTLSGGQFQRVLLARALLARPNLLLLDEPTQGLDQPATASFYQTLSDVASSLDAAILIVSHDLHVVMSASDQVICLNGHVCCHGPPNVVSTAPEYRALFGHGTAGTLALYQHDHDHVHDHPHEHD